MYVSEAVFTPELFSQNKVNLFSTLICFIWADVNMLITLELTQPPGVCCKFELNTCQVSTAYWNPAVQDECAQYGFGFGAPAGCN